MGQRCFFLGFLFGVRGAWTSPPFSRFSFSCGNSSHCRRFVPFFSIFQKYTGACKPFLSSLFFFFSQGALVPLPPAFSSNTPKRRKPGPLLPFSFLFPFPFASLYMGAEEVRTRMPNLGSALPFFSFPLLRLFFFRSQHRPGPLPSPPCFFCLFFFRGKSHRAIFLSPFSSFFFVVGPWNLVLPSPFP